MSKTEKHELAGKRCVAYLRVSTDQQDRNDSPQRQRDTITSWADERGIQIQHWYYDVRSRDQIEKGTDHAKMMQAVRESKLDAVIVSSKDRYGTRDLWQYGAQICEFRRHGCQLWSCLEGHLSGDDMVTHILASIGSTTEKKEQVLRADRTIGDRLTRVRRGEWAGGYPPLGYDLGAFDRAGILLWVLRYERQHKRVQIFPDGRQVRYDGDGYVPSRAEGQVLRLVPSSEDRVETVQQLFRWFATEAISLHALAVRANQLGLSPVIGKGFYASKLRPLLSNRAYLTGSGEWNKRGNGRHMEYTAGKPAAVKRHNDKIKTGRKRDQADRIIAAGEHHGIIDADTFNTVQAKLAGIKGHRKAPKNSKLYLAGLAYCGHCGERMVGWSQKSALSYTCSTYRRYGKHNIHGCKLHRISHIKLDRLITHWLDESQQKCEMVLQAQADGAIIRALQSERYLKIATYCQRLDGMRRFVEAVGGETGIEIEGEYYPLHDLTTTYVECFEQQREQTQAQLADATEQLRSLVLSQSRLSGMALELALEEIARLEGVVASLRASLTPLHAHAHYARQALQRATEAIRNARTTMEGDNGRQKAEALGRILGRVVLHFEYKMAGSQERSHLVKAVFEPLIGEPQEVDFRNGSWPLPISVAKMCCRTYQAAELAEIGIKAVLNSARLGAA